MMISKVDHGESINWDVIMYSQLVKELIRWDKCKKNMRKGTTKREPKKDVCHYTIVLEVLFHKWFPLEGVESHEKKKQVEQPQEDKRKINSMREGFIKNKRLLNPTHISFKKDKQPIFHKFDLRLTISLK
jgi:hypothetical protein